MKLTRRAFGALTAAASAAATVSVLLTPESAWAQQGDTLVIAVPSGPTGFEPGSNAAEPIGSEIILNVFDTLVTWTPPAFTSLEGRLATDWTVSDDGRVFTLNLREGVLFHDGTPFNAAAVKVSLERTMAMNPYVEATLGLIEGIETPSGTQVVITLAQPYPAFLSILAQPQSAIVSPTAVDAAGDGFANAPVGTGPFMIRDYQADTRVVLDANPNYFRGPSGLNRLIYVVIPDASTRRLELENGGVDIIQQSGQLAAVPTEEMAAFAGNPDIRIIESPSQIIRQLEFNNALTDGPFADVRVRRAIAHAIDYDGLLSGVFGGTADRVYGPLTSDSWAFNPAVVDMAPRYDPDRSRALLAEAGVDPASLDVTLYSFQGALWAQVATFIQANLADIGVAVGIAQTEFPSYRALHVAGEYQMALDGRQPWYNDPDAHITIGYLSTLRDSAMTFRMPQDEALDGLIVAAQQEVDTERRRELYFQAQEMIVERVPAAYLFSPKLIVFARSNVEGLVINSAPPLNEYWGVTKN